MSVVYYDDTQELKDYMITYPRMPWWMPPYNAIWFDQVGSATVTNLNSPLSLVQFNLNKNERGVIRWFGQTLNPANVDNQVTWQMLIDGSPDRVYGSIVGLISSVIVPTETLIKIPAGGTVSLQVSTANVTGIQAIGRLKGWSWVVEQ